MIDTILSGDSAFGYDANVGDADIDGAEVAAAVSLSPALTLFLVGSWTDAGLAEDQRSPAAPGQGSAGDRVPDVPRLAGNASLAWSGRVADRMRLDAPLDVLGRGAHASQFDPAIAGYARTPAQVQLDGHVVMEHTRWSLSLTMRKLLNERRPDQILVTGLGERQSFGPYPRAILLTLAGRI